MAQEYHIVFEYDVVKRITAVRKGGTFRETWPKRKTTQNAFGLQEKRKREMQSFKLALKDVLLKHTLLHNNHNCIQSLACVANSRQKKGEIISTFQCLHKAKWFLHVDTSRNSPKSIRNWLNVKLVVHCNQGKKK